MGIKSINKLLQEKAPQAFMKIPLSCFSGSAVAIDSHILIYKYMSAASNMVIDSMANPLDVIDNARILKIAMEKFLDFIKTLFDYKITPVMIFDGPPVAAKTKCLEGRKAEKMKKIKRINDERTVLEELHVLKITTEELNSYKKTLKMSVKISMTEIREFQRVFASIGIKTFMASGDAEKLCSALNRERIVAGVWGTDTDNYALGTPILVTGLAGRIDGQYQVDIVRLETVLEVLNVPLQFITDLCIMCGCDFNENIPKIGPARSLELLHQVKSIDNLPPVYKKIPLNIDILDHFLCREAFAYEPSGINPNDIIIDWDDYLINIEDVVNKYVDQNKQRFLSFRGF